MSAISDVFLDVYAFLAALRQDKDAQLLACMLLASKEGARLMVRTTPAAAAEAEEEEEWEEEEREEDLRGRRIFNRGRRIRKSASLSSSCRRVVFYKVERGT